MAKASSELNFWIYKHVVNLLPFALINNQLNSMVSDFFLEKSLKWHGFKISFFSYCTSASVTSLPPERTADCIPFSSTMQTTPQEVIHSISFFHKPYPLHVNTTSSFTSMFKHFCFTAIWKLEHMAQSQKQIQFSFTRHTTQQPIKQAIGLRRYSYMMGIIWLAKIWGRVLDIQGHAKNCPNTNFVNDNYIYFENQPTFSSCIII